MPKDEKVSYPMLPPKSWWALRKQFEKSMPAKATASYLATVLGITEKSAQANVLPFLKTLGIVGDDNKPTPLANKWRFDEDYKKVCDEIRKKVFPQELLDALPGPVIDRAPVERWFATKTGAGQSASRRMATLYILLAEADPKKGGKAAKTKATATKPRKPKKQDDDKGKETMGDTHTQPPLIQVPPTIHLDLQIHLSPEAPPEQIDKIFESMAKHLKGLYTKSKTS